MTVRYGDAQTLCGEVRAVCGNYFAALYLAPDFERLSLGFLLLAADVGDDVVYHLGPCLKGLARAGDSLIGADENILDSELRKREQRRNIALERAVRFDGDESALCAEPLSLRLDYVGVIGVELGDYHRNIGREAVCAVVRNNGALRLRVFELKRLYLILVHVDRAENEIDSRRDFFNICLGVQNRHISELFGDGAFHAPFGSESLLVCLARRA